MKRWCNNLPPLTYEQARKVITTFLKDYQDLLPKQVHGGAIGNLEMKINIAARLLSGMSEEQIEQFVGSVSYKPNSAVHLIEGAKTLLILIRNLKPNLLMQLPKNVTPQKLSLTTNEPDLDYTEIDE